MKEEYIAVRTVTSNSTGEIKCYVASACDYLHYSQGKHEPHKVMYYWDFDGKTFSKGHGIVGFSSHVTTYNEEGVETIQKIVNRLNNELLGTKMTNANKEDRRQILLKHTKTLNLAKRIEEAHLDPALIKPKEKLDAWHMLF